MYGIKSVCAKILANYIVKQEKYNHLNAEEVQERILKNIIKIGRSTSYGKEHNFDRINNYNEFKESVPLVDYEGIKGYIEQIIEGRDNVLWRGKPIYFAKTSGTTSGTKYIPITRESIHNHIDSARNMLLFYIYNSGDTSFLGGKMIFLQGSPELYDVGGIKTGRLSGIVAHHVPGYLQKNRLPTYKTNCIEDWEAKIEAIVNETIRENMTLISGIPPWVQMYYDRIIEITGKRIGEVFPNLKLFVYGGVNYEPYRNRIEDSIGMSVQALETYPASEGFIAYQSDLGNNGLLITLNSGIFYEFVPVEDIGKTNPRRFTIGEVEEGRNYAIVINSNAGLWGYVLGDTVRFVSLKPYKLVVTGRISHYISAFGEHVIAEEIEQSLKEALSIHECKVNEFTVAPVVNSGDELPYHEWLIEFEEEPRDMEGFRLAINESLCKKNIYYNDLIRNKILQPLKIRTLPKNTFINYMRAEGKLGSQNKVPRLSNDREIADKLCKISISI